MMRSELAAVQSQTLSDCRHLEITLQAARCEHTAADAALQSALQTSDQLLRAAVNELFVAQDQLCQMDSAARARLYPPTDARALEARPLELHTGANERRPLAFPEAAREAAPGTWSSSDGVALADPSQPLAHSPPFASTPSAACAAADPRSRASSGEPSYGAPDPLSALAAMLPPGAAEAAARDYGSS
eukprot:7200665-Prymnesium_polylepis.1